MTDVQINAGRTGIYSIAKIGLLKVGKENFALICISNQWIADYINKKNTNGHYSLKY